MYRSAGISLANHASWEHVPNGIHVWSSLSLDINISPPVSLSIVSGKRNVGDGDEVFKQKQHKRVAFVNMNFINEYAIIFFDKYAPWDIDLYADYLVQINNIIYQKFHNHLLGNKYLNFNGYFEQIRS